MVFGLQSQSDGSLRSSEHPSVLLGEKKSHQEVSELLKSELV